MSNNHHVTGSGPRAGRTPRISGGAWANMANIVQQTTPPPPQQQQQQHQQQQQQQHQRQQQQPRQRIRQIQQQQRQAAPVPVGHHHVGVNRPPRMRNPAGPTAALLRRMAESARLTRRIVDLTYVNERMEERLPIEQEIRDKQREVVDLYQRFERNEDRLKAVEEDNRQLARTISAYQVQEGARYRRRRAMAGFH